ncbi:hypothetical protein [Saccharopolyspora erythraea]|uniref:hypothetical protein n=1 Tax=Saccharopolyspora erythraea TaxID=1836 RepID=UPI00201158E7|nr:hypothetical protein [Saccharopolyspora erythraea]
MDGYRVFLWGWADSSLIARTLEALRPFDTLDGPVGPAELIGMRDGVLVEVTREGADATRVRFVDAGGPADAWTAAHSFLWVVTRRLPVEEALLLGDDTEPLHYREGRIRAVPTSGERY